MCKSTSFPFIQPRHLPARFAILVSKCKLNCSLPSFAPFIAMTPRPPHITPFEKVQTRDSDTEDIPQFVWHLQWHTWQELGKKRGRKKKIENWGGVLRWDASQLHMVFHAERLCWRFFNGLKWMPGIGTPPKTPTQKLKAQIPETKGQMRSLSVGPLWCGGSAYGQVERFLFLYSDSDSDAES